MPRISLCMITKNEEAMLPGCLRSVEGAVDEIIVVDTGSHDRTREIAESFGARVFDHTWNDDFAAARNESLARATGDWILQLDADERLFGDGAKILRRAVRKASFDCGLVRLHNAATAEAPAAEVVSGHQRIGGVTLLPRLLRRTDDLRYRGIIHESVEDWVVARGKKIELVGADLIHLGQTVAIRAQRGKSNRNVTLLRKRCQQEPDNIIPYGYLAMELIFADDLEQAFEVVERGWNALARQPAHRSPLRLAIARARLLLGKGDAAGAMEAIAVGRRDEPNHPDLHYLLGCALEIRGRSAPRGSRRHRRTLDEAGQAFAHAIEVKGVPNQGQFVAGATGWASWNRIGTVMLMLGVPDQAVSAFDAALAEMPNNVEAVLGKAEALIDLGAYMEAVELLEPLEDDHADRHLLAAEAAEGIEAFPEMQRLLSAARQAASRGYMARHRANRHIESRMALSILAGAPFAGPGRLGLLCGIMAREPNHRDAELPEPYDLQRAARLALLSGHGDLLAPLFEPRAEELVPGIAKALAELLAGWGLQVEDDGVLEPIFLLGDDGSAVDALADLLAAHPALAVEPSSCMKELPDAVAVQRNGGPTARRRVWRSIDPVRDAEVIAAKFASARVLVIASSSSELESEAMLHVRDVLGRTSVAHLDVTYHALLAEPPRTIETLLAFLGLSNHETVLRKLILTYPGLAESGDVLIRRAS